MASKFLDFAPPVAAALKVGTPIVAIETGFFMRLPYPKNMAALQECEQAFWRRDCVPCCIGVVDGRLKAGLTKEDMDTLCRAGGAAARGDLPNLVADRRSSGTGASATLAIAKMADIVPVMAPGLTDSLADMDALSASSRMLFCGKVAPDRAMLYAARSVAVLRSGAGAFGILAAIFCRRLVRVRPMSLVRGALLAGVFFALLTAEMNGFPCQSDAVVVHTLDALTRMLSY